MPISAHLNFAALNGALKAAGESTRLRILALLGEAEVTVSDLTDILRQSQPRISRHLRLLAEAAQFDRSALVASVEEAVATVSRLPGPRLLGIWVDYAHRHSLAC